MLWAFFSAAFSQMARRKTHNDVPCMCREDERRKARDKQNLEDIAAGKAGWETYNSFWYYYYNISDLKINYFLKDYKKTT